MPQRQVDYADVIGRLQLYGRLYRLDDRALRPHTLTVQYLKADEVYVGRNTLDGYVTCGAPGIRPVTTDDAGDVRTVPVEVVTALAGVIEGGPETRTAGRGFNVIHGVDTAIDHRNSNVGAVKPDAPRIVRHNGHCCIVQAAADWSIGRYVGYLGIRCQRCQRPSRHYCSHTVNHTQLSRNLNPLQPDHAWLC